MEDDRAEGEVRVFAVSEVDKKFRNISYGSSPQNVSRLEIPMKRAAFLLGFIKVDAWVAHRMDEMLDK